jgi:hypothetical protein
VKVIYPVFCVTEALFSDAIKKERYLSEKQMGQALILWNLVYRINIHHWQDIVIAAWQCYPCGTGAPMLQGHGTRIFNRFVVLHHP